ncbi:MAG: hypothetical protein ACRD6X_10465, partial [Pyrinomonadaceae bacterium]
DVSIGNLNGKESIGTNGHAATGLPYLDEQLLQTRSNRSPLSLFVSQNPRILFWSLSILLGLILVPFVLGAVSYFFNPNPTIGEKLEVVQLFTPETKLEGDVMSVSFSPDGKYVLFEVLDDGINKIFDRLATGSEMVQITDGRSKEHSPVWSPDGMRIAFISDRDNTVGIRIVSYLGGESSLQIPMSPEPLSYRLVKWSKDGKSIFFETTDGKLNTVELDSRRINEIALTTPDKKSEFRVSPDESRVVYKVTENGSQQLWLQSLGRSEATKLTNNKYRNSSPCWFPDNARIAFHSNRTGTFQIYVTDLSGKKVERITFSNFSSYNPVVSPDGLKIYTKLAQNYDNN